MYTNEFFEIRVPSKAIDVVVERVSYHVDTRNMLSGDLSYLELYLIIFLCIELL